MELRHYVGILRRSWRLLLGLPLVVAVITLALGLILPPTYTVTAQVLVTQAPIPSTTAPLTLPNYESYHSWVASEYIDDDMPQLVQTRRFTTDVANWIQAQHGQTLDPGDLTDQFSAERQHRMILLTTTHPDKNVALWMAQGAVAVLKENGLGYWERQENASLSVSEVDMPLEAEREKGLVGLALDVVLRSVLALVLAVGIAFLLYYMDRSLRSSAQVEALGIVAAGTIPRAVSPRSSAKSSGLVTVAEPHDPAAEGYRALRTRLLYGRGETTLRTILVTSATAAEDRATVVANLAASFAQANQRVVLVDADLRRPALHTLFGLSNDNGLTNVLMVDGQRPAVQPTKIAGLSLLAAGPANDQSADLLASDRMDAAITTLLQSADVVLFNTPPVTVLTDAAVLATKVDGALVVLRAERTNQDRARTAVRVLEQVNANVIGAVLTDAPVDIESY